MEETGCESVGVNKKIAGIDSKTRWEKDSAVAATKSEPLGLNNSITKFVWKNGISPVAPSASP